MKTSVQVCTTASLQKANEMWPSLQLKKWQSVQQGTNCWNILNNGQTLKTSVLNKKTQKSMNHVAPFI